MSPYSGETLIPTPFGALLTAIFSLYLLLSLSGGRSEQRRRTLIGKFERMIEKVHFSNLSQFFQPAENVYLPALRCVVNLAGLVLARVWE
jgi:hypothetical protein